MSEPVLILSGSIGAGHDAVAAACAGALESAGAQSEVLDCLALQGRWRARASDAAFRALLRRAGLYDAFHFSQLRAASPLAERLAHAAAAALERPLVAALDDCSARLAIAVFATGAGALGRLRSKRPDLRAVVVLTDATAHRLWAHRGIDRYLALSTLASATLRRYLPNAEVPVIAPPVRPACYGAPSPAIARRRLDIFPGDESASELRVALLAAGAWGGAALDELSIELLERGFGVIALAGRNEALRRRLEALATALPATRRDRFVVRGWTAGVPELMAASDVVVTTAGQACHEARAVGRPLVLLDVVPGHGRENLLAELAAGGALAAGSEPGAVSAAVKAVLAGAAGRLPPWPVPSLAAWNAQFLTAIDDLRSP